MTDERTTFLADQVGRILTAAMDRNPDAVALGLEEVGERYGHDGVFGICYAMASVVHTLAFPQIKRGDGSLTGDMLAIERLPDTGADDPSSLWAARFVTSYVNGDGGTTAALFYGSLDDQDRTVGQVISLIAMAADIARQKEQDAQDSGNSGS